MTGDSPYRAAEWPTTLNFSMVGLSYIYRDFVDCHTSGQNSLVWRAHFRLTLTLSADGSQVSHSWPSQASWSTRRVTTVDERESSFGVHVFVSSQSRMI